MRQGHPKPILQAGCLPVRNRKGRGQVLLVTSRYTGQWIAPKGGIEPGESAREAAEREAAEEAGVHGEIVKRLGWFEYPRAHRIARVEVFLLKVTEQLDDWPERGERRRRWFTVEEAFEIVQRPEVLAMLEAATRASERTVNRR